MVRIGFIGLGNMGGALMGAMIKKGVCQKEELSGTDKIQAAMDRAASTYGIRTSSDVASVVSSSDYIFLSVKPQDVEKTMAKLRPAWSKSKVLISICAGVQLCTLQAFLGKAKLVRVMPNTPALVGVMAAGYAPNKYVTDEEAEQVGKILGAAGVAYKLPESALDAVTGLSGSGPAYVAHMIGEFAKAGEQVGLAPEVSYGLSLQTFKGAATLMQERKMTPEQLKKMVTSPNGTTHAGRLVLEASNLPQIMLATVKAGTDRSKELGAAAAAAALRPKL